MNTDERESEEEEERMNHGDTESTEARGSATDAKLFCHPSTHPVLHPGSKRLEPQMNTDLSAEAWAKADEEKRGTAGVRRREGATNLHEWARMGRWRMPDTG